MAQKMERISRSLLQPSLDIIFDYCISFRFYKLSNSITGCGNNLTDMSLNNVTLFPQENARNNGPTGFRPRYSSSTFLQSSFDVQLTVHLSVILVIHQLDAQILVL